MFLRAPLDDGRGVVSPAEREGALNRGQRRRDRGKVRKRPRSSDTRRRDKGKKRTLTPETRVILSCGIYQSLHYYDVTILKK